MATVLDVSNQGKSVMPGGSANEVLDRMVSDGQIQRVDYRGQTYFATGVGRFKTSGGR